MQPLTKFPTLFIGRDKARQTRLDRKPGDAVIRKRLLTKMLAAVAKYYVDQELLGGREKKLD